MCWQEKYAAELKQTILLKNVCSDLREEFEQYSLERRSSLGNNFIDAREVPSKKVYIWVYIQECIALT